MVCSFFLGANTPKGFYSLFSQLDGFDLNVVKGGCGSGKSTLIKSMIYKTDFSGICERILCSSDHDSLDGAVFHSLNAAIVDGTSPHIAETRGLGKYIVTPPATENMENRRAMLDALKSAKAKAYEDAYASLSGYCNTVNRLLSLIPFNSEHFSQRAYGIFKRESVKKHGKGKVLYRFLDCINGNGFSTLWTTVHSLANKIYVIEDDYSLAADFFKRLEQSFSSAGYMVYSCLSPLFPDQVRHIIVPQLGLAFVTSDSLSKYNDEAFRRVHTSSCIDKIAYRATRQKIRLFQKISEEFLKDSVDSLKNAQIAHRELENLYLPYLDTTALDELIKSEKI